ncbi:hypothetical protein AX774_g98 [Zancudomyces culisetae]|uniref:SGF29 C-terminal domain-containing protein n=1 Tax=Zancudomyces culisetae TaxID=1213189 RepID=A0A1R1PZE9_ZANCU|nr:hypothetical protein AX774_g98 [Zancudomyces culisetae]|eukprot:OMH86340.1 hypothetical protein AX774_g98 [Zancudomyces culisetae]
MMAHEQATTINGMELLNTQEKVGELLKIINGVYKKYHENDQDWSKISEKDKETLPETYEMAITETKKEIHLIEDLLKRIELYSEKDGICGGEDKEIENDKEKVSKVVTKVVGGKSTRLDNNDSKDTQGYDDERVRGGRSISENAMNTGSSETDAGKTGDSEAGAITKGGVVVGAEDGERYEKEEESKKGGGDQASKNSGDGKGQDIIQSEEDSGKVKQEFNLKLYFKDEDQGQEETTKPKKEIATGGLNRRIKLEKGESGDFEEKGGKGLKSRQSGKGVDSRTRKEPSYVQGNTGQKGDRYEGEGYKSSGNKKGSNENENKDKALEDESSEEEKATQWDTKVANMKDGSGHTKGQGSIGIGAGIGAGTDGGRAKLGSRNVGKGNYREKTITMERVSTGTAESTPTEPTTPTTTSLGADRGRSMERGHESKVLEEGRNSGSPSSHTSTSNSSNSYPTPRSRQPVSQSPYISQPQPQPQPQPQSQSQPQPRTSVSTKDKGRSFRQLDFSRDRKTPVHIQTPPKEPVRTATDEKLSEQPIATQVVGAEQQTTAGTKRGSENIDKGGIEAGLRSKETANGPVKRTRTGDSGGEQGSTDIKRRSGSVSASATEPTGVTDFAHLIKVGSYVAAKMPSEDDPNGEWILAIVRTISADKKKYTVEDVDEISDLSQKAKTASPNLHVLSRAQVIFVSDPFTAAGDSSAATSTTTSRRKASHASTALSPADKQVYASKKSIITGDRVLGIYPNTTVFYRGEIIKTGSNPGPSDLPHFINGSLATADHHPAVITFLKKWESNYAGKPFFTILFDNDDGRLTDVPSILVLKEN